MITNRNQTRVYERTLHDREIDSTNNDESFEIIDEAVGQAKPLGKALEKLHFLEWFDYYFFCHKRRKFLNRHETLTQSGFQSGPKTAPLAAVS